MTEENTSEEFRRIQLTGGSTYIISLPKTWINELGLTKGSLISMTLKKDQTLLLQAKDREPSDKTRRASITLGNVETSETAIQKLIAIYLQGYTIIEIRGNAGRVDPLIRAKIKDFTRRKLVGTEVVGDFPESLTLQILLSYTDLSVADALRRMSVIAASMHRNALEGLTTGNADILREVISMDDEIDRFSFYLMRLVESAVSDYRILEETGIRLPKLCVGYRVIVKNIERLADHAVRIAESQLEVENLTVKEPIASKLRELSELALRVFEDAMNSLYAMDFQTASQVLSLRDETSKLRADLIDAINHARSSEKTPHLRLVADSLRRTADYGSDIAETVMNMTARDLIREA